MASLELLHQLPSVFNKRAAGSLRCTIQFVTPTPAYITIAEETCTVTDGTTTGVDLCITISDENLTQLLKGKLNPVTGLMLRKLKADGDLDLGLRLTSLFDFSKL